jgi:hypothetical protein
MTQRHTVTHFHQILTMLEHCPISGKFPLTTAPHTLKKERKILGNFKNFSFLKVYYPALILMKKRF